MTVEIPLTQGQVAIVDDIDADLAQVKWCAHYKGGGRFYATRNLKGAPNQHMHRVVMERMVGGLLTEDYVVDHINHNTLDNRRSNLRVATHAQNIRNRKNKKVGISGVTLSQSGGFITQATFEGETKYLGTFQTEGEAFVVYCDFIIEHHGQFASFDEDLYRHYKALYPTACANQNARNLTDEQIEQICRLLSQGETQESVAEQMSITQSSVSRVKLMHFDLRVQRGELPKPPKRPSKPRPNVRRLTEVERQQIYREASQGIPQTKIAAKWGITQAAVSRIKSVYGQAQS